MSLPDLRADDLMPTRQNTDAAHGGASEMMLAPYPGLGPMHVYMHVMCRLTWCNVQSVLRDWARYVFYTKSIKRLGKVCLLHEEGRTSEVSVEESSFETLLSEDATLLA